MIRGKLVRLVRYLAPMLAWLALILQSLMVLREHGQMLLLKAHLLIGNPQVLNTQIAGLLRRIRFKVCPCCVL